MKSIKKLEKYLQSLSNSYSSIEKVLAGDYDDEIEEMREHYKSFRNFIPSFWLHAGASSQFIPGWHIDAMADHLEALYYCYMNYLLIAAVPRLGKSTIGLCLFPAWTWTQEPQVSLLTCSYDSELAQRDNKNFQQCMNSPLYQQLWGKRFYLTSSNRNITINSKNGRRTATSIDGAATGSGGNMVLIDDPNNVRYANSPSVRKKTTDWWDTVLPSRINDFTKRRYLLQQQRCHQEDLFGHVKARNLPGTVVLELMMKMELDRRCSTIILPGQTEEWIDPRTEENELLAPTQFPPEVVRDFELNSGSVIFAGQFQQRPSPAKGAVFEKDWFKLWKTRELPEFDMVILGVDTAISVEASAAYSATSCWGLFNHPVTNSPSLMLLQTWFGRYEWTDLRQMIIQQSYNYRDVELGRVSEYRNSPDLILIEAKSNGMSLVQSLQRAGIDFVQPYNPPKTHKKGPQDLRSSQGKIQRARLIATVPENGKIWIPAQPPRFEKPYQFGENFLEAVINFPNNIMATMDLIDTFTMVVEYLQRKELLYLNDSAPQDPEMIEPLIMRSF